MEITFKDFILQKKNFDITMHNLYVKLLTDKKEVEVNTNTLFFFNSKFTTIKKLKKKINNCFNFEIKTLDKNTIIMKREDLLFLLLKYGSLNFKSYLTTLPFYIDMYDEYINDMKFNIS